MTLRVALCITELEAGGAERMLVELARRLDRARFTPAVYVLGPRPHGDEQTLADELDWAGVETHFLGASSVWALPGTVRRLTALFRASRPDVLQSFLFHANVVGPWAARRAGVPRVLTGIRVAERHSAWHRQVARRTAHWAARHVCVSQSVADFTSDVTRIDRQSLTVIPNGVDVSRFAGAAPLDLAGLGLPAGRRAFALVGRLERQKGADWLFDLLPGVFAAQASHDLLVVGSGPERRALESQAHRLGIASRVHFTGPRADIPGLLAAVNGLVLPSRWEGMPNVVLEAMASGKPVVATNVEGVAELLGPENAGQIVPAGDAQAFCEALVNLLGQPARAAELGRQNSRRIAEHFTLERMVAAYERLFESGL
jgi:glycosyltransferase involved in cell wall biosynthesis